ncbi:MAG TPA: AsmA family protein [Verrucomicrobiae bacterium]|nr:AsmA family protein [Verrucomicrobiae bacterium]
MTDTTTSSPRPKRRRGLKILGWIVGIFVVLLVSVYFIATSSGFLKSVILPRVGKSLNADITVSDASIHPFSSVTFRDLKVTPHGKETLLTAPEIRAGYSLTAILGGNLKIEEVVITSPTIHLVEQPDGSSNLDPILNANKESTESSKGESKESSKPPQIDLQRLAISNGTIQHEKIYSADQRDSMVLTNVTVTLNNLKNGDSGKLALNANALIENNPPAPGTNGVLQAVVNGEYVFAFSADLKPLSINGETQLKVARAEGAFSELAAASATLSADVAPTEIKQIALKFQKNGEPLGDLHAHGPFNFEKVEGRLKVELAGIDKRLLNLAGAGSGIDFGTARLTSTNDIELANGGKSVSIVGRFNADKLQLTRTNQTTPTLDFHADYNVSVDSAASNAVVRTLTLTGTQNGKPLLNGELTSPMTLSFGGAESAVGDSALNLTLANLNFADWKPFVGDAISEGTANLKLKLLSQQGGKQLTLDIVSQLANVAPIGGDKKLSSANLSANLAVQLAENDAKTIKGGAQFSNIVVLDPTGAIPPSPLEAKLQLDTTLAKDTVDLRQLQITLTPTERAQNQLQLQGRVNMADTNAIQGNLKLTAESLDVTRYYDLFTGATNETAKQTSAPANAPSTETTQPEQEPEAQTLPFKNFVIEASIGSFYLREVAITNLQTTLKLDGGHVVLNPFAFVLNGAPVKATADVDLSVPGYRYAIDFSADRIPVAPLADSFAPEYRGKAAGDLIAKLNLKGTGTTGVNLQKNLSGDANLSFTNANIQVAGRWQKILTTIAAALRVPELANSPINFLTSEINIANGNINLSEFRAKGDAFAASSQGTIAIAPVLTNSVIQNLPVNFALSRNIAARAGFKNPGDTNNAYVDLGAIAHVSGTVGDPQPEIDYARIALFTGQQLIGGTAGEVLRSIGGSGNGTNAGVGNLIQGLGGLLGGKPAQTNAPNGGSTTNQSAPTNEAPLLDILKSLGPRKK